MDWVRESEQTKKKQGEGEKRKGYIEIWIKWTHRFFGFMPGQGFGPHIARNEKTAHENKKRKQGSTPCDFYQNN